ncbi:MAG: toxin-antitoxin system protein [Gemmatimonadetes bacterium]|nr:toxin-antitoxin system protein [Gemmatimonadota bacterium]
MAASAQARITDDSRERLVRLTEKTGKTQQEVIDTALKAYERELFLDGVNASFAALKADPQAWKQYQEDQAEWETATNADGLD